MKHLCTLLLLLFTIPLSAEEPSTETRLAKWLKKYPDADANKDGVLTMEEAEAYRDAMQSARKKEKAPRIQPTYADVVYGDHERNRLDVWIPEKPSADGLPYPILIFFHGGGFVSGDKSSFTPSAYLEAGIACASVNYRLVDGESTLSPAPMEDSARALQTIRHRAADWNIDGGRIALSGGSAGAVITLWLGYHDDLADPESEDPVSRQSTRVTCLLPVNGPANLMPDWILENIGGPKHVHGSFVKLFGEPVTSPVSESMRKKVAEISPWEFVSGDDPPTLLIYTGSSEGTPLPETATTGESIHHAAFGKALKERLDEVGVEAEFREAFDPRGAPDMVDYVKTQFGMME